MSSDSRSAGATSPMKATAPTRSSEKPTARTNIPTTATASCPLRVPIPPASARRVAEAPLAAIPTLMSGLRPSRSASPPERYMNTICPVGLIASRTPIVASVSPITSTMYTGSRLPTPSTVTFRNSTARYSQRSRSFAGEPVRRARERGGSGPRGRSPPLVSDRSGSRRVVDDEHREEHDERDEPHDEVEAPGHQEAEEKSRRQLAGGEADALRAAEQPDRPRSSSPPQVLTIVNRIGRYAAANSA